MNGPGLPAGIPAALPEAVVQVAAPQIAALPIRFDSKGKLRVLMVTSRRTRRWVMPKGWHMEGKAPNAAAEIEALEEAGAVGFISTEAIGSYAYRKQMGDGRILPCRVTVYPMMVEKLKRRWKERRGRTRRWFAPRRAARLVEEPELAELLRQLAGKPRKHLAIKRLLNEKRDVRRPASSGAAS